MSVHTKQIIARLRDKGCIENVLPVALSLHNAGHDVSVYLDEGDTIARGLFDSSLKTIEYIPKESVAISCLPLGSGFKAIKESGSWVILIQENPDWHDERFPSWERLKTIAEICTVSKASTKKHPATLVTGLPAIDIAARNVAEINSDEVRLRTGLEDAKSVISIALPGNTVGCMHMIDALQYPPSLTYHLLPRSHPKLAIDDPKGFQSVKERLSALFDVDLSMMNKMVTSDESIALSKGKTNFFVTTHNSSLAWQATGAGVENVLVLPPEIGTQKWINSAPIIQSGFGDPLIGKPTRATCKTTLTTGGAIENIAQAVVAHL